MKFHSRFEMVLYLWDYFYVSHAPPAGDEATWATIERATCRIREAEIDLDDRKPPDVRLHSARRIGKAARLCLRSIEQLSVRPEQWVIDGLAELVATTERMIETLSDEASKTPLH